MTAPVKRTRPANTGARRPINAAAAARQAAHARPGEELRYRQAAAGVSAERAARMGGGTRNRTPRGLLAASIAVGAALALVVLILVGRALMGVALFDDRAAQAPAAAASSASGAASSAASSPNGAVDAEGTLTFNGRDFSIRTTAEGVSFCGVPAGTDAVPNTLFTLTGDPVGFALYEGTFFVVSNANGTCYVQSFLMGDGSLPADFASAPGEATSVALEGTELVIERADADPLTVEVSS